ncbi:MAG: type II toxin-antitoxin system mRNA interferase toxin, RelE/StbE family [Patescibacteria group bacterium]|mgnify:CR=1 FL=1
MNIFFHRQFRKHFKERIENHAGLVVRYHERVMLFQENPHHPLIRDHALTGAKHGFRSFSITGDIRIIYFQEDNDVQFYDIGTHNQVY